MLPVMPPPADGVDAATVQQPVLQVKAPPFVPLISQLQWEIDELKEQVSELKEQICTLEVRNSILEDQNADVQEQLQQAGAQTKTNCVMMYDQGMQTVDTRCSKWPMFLNMTFNKHVFKME